MRCFKNIAHLIRTKRLQHPKGYSQSELSNLLGYKNGQFISNVERALCNIPLKMLVRVSEVLDIDPEDLKKAILKDHDATLDNYLKGAQTQSADVKPIHAGSKESAKEFETEGSSASSYKLSSNS